MPRTLVAIPALNESATLPSVVAEVRAALPQARVLVVDDGSSDGTAHVARAAGAEVLVLPFNVGVGGAMRTAFRYARVHRYDQLVQVDADGQHVAAHLPALLAALHGPDAASVVIGGRFTAGYPIHGPRRWAMQVLARSLSRVCNTPLTDTTSGFRAADARAIALFADHYPAEYLGDTVESLVLAARAGLTIREVPVSMRPRQGGAASHSPMRASLQLGRAMLALYVALAGRRTPPALVSTSELGAAAPAAVPPAALAPASRAASEFRPPATKPSSHVLADASAHVEAPAFEPEPLPTPASPTPHAALAPAARNPSELRP